MRVVMIWRDNTEHARVVIDWMEDFRRRTGREIENLSPDDAEGESLCRAYDVVEYPSLLALDIDGSLVRMWRGAEMPLIDDVNYYLIHD